MRENLIKCGAFDSFKVKRSQQMQMLEKVVMMAQKNQKVKNKNQMSIFHVLNESVQGAKAENISYPDIPEWEEKERLACEKECLGFYITGHPLDNYRHILNSIAFMDAESALAQTTGKPITVGGIVAALKPVTIKKGQHKGEKMGIVTLEDLTGSIDVIAFSEVYRNCMSLLEGDQPIMVKGDLSIETDKPGGNSILARKIMPLEKAYETTLPEVHIRCLINIFKEDVIEKLKNIINNNPGKSPVFCHVIIPEQKETVIRFGDEFKIKPSGLCVKAIEALLKKGCVTLH